MNKIPRNNQDPYGNFRGSYLPFLLHGVGGQPLKVPLKSCLIFTLGKCKQTTVFTAERDKVVTIFSNAAAVATCPRNSGFDCDSLSTTPEEAWSGARCSSLLQSDVTTAWQQTSLSEGRCTQILILLCVLKGMRWLVWKWALSCILMCYVNTHEYLTLNP